MIEILYYGNIRAAAGKSGEEIDSLPGATVFQVLQGLSGAYGDNFRSEIFDESGSGFRDDLMIAVNEAVISRENVAGTVLEPGDALAVYPIFPGGG